ncbi:MAG TPA: hypothetical protein VFW75_02925 [Acetobacteraceae bacterium]|nr:hypothetical protein [Acetobacteraceae bacterium]
MSSDVDVRMGARSGAAVVRVSPAPKPGQPAAGHGVRGTILAVPAFQPLAADRIWRVVLAGEPFGRLVREAGAVWHLLQVDELTDAQLDEYDATMPPDC